MEATTASGSKADEVIALLEQVLQEVDMSITTQRQVINKLAEALGEEVYEFKALIKEHITKYLASQPAGEAAPEAPTDSQDDLSEQAAEGPASTKRKRDAGDDQNAGAKIAKASQEDDECVVALSSSRQVQISKFKGTVYVNIREWYDKDGKLAPGKGVSLQVPHWRVLTADVDNIATAVLDEDTNYVCKLSQKHQATVKMFKGKVQVDLREYYEKNGELLPGKKGIALDIPQWEKLSGAVPDIDTALQQESGPSAGQSTAEPAKGNSTAPNHASAAAAAAATADDTELSGKASDLPIQLSAMRKADVSDFHGTVYVNIREYYEKGGKQLPGKKGISLPSDQFQKLVEIASSLTEALEARDTQFEVPLSGKRKANISEFKGKLMVNIREYYEKDGESKPGAKGISLPPEQWHKLAAGLGALNAALKDQTP